MTVCRSLAEVRAAALADAKNDPPLTQDQADLVAAILAPYREPSTLMLTVEEAAGQLRIGRSRVFGLIASGDLPSVKIGSSRRIRSSDLAEYVASLPAAP